MSLTDYTLASPYIDLAKARIKKSDIYCISSLLLLKSSVFLVTNMLTRLYLLFPICIIYLPFVLTQYSLARPTFTKRCFITPLSFIACYIWGSYQNIRRTVTPKCYNATIGKVVPDLPAIFGLPRILTFCCKEQFKTHFSNSERDFNIFYNKEEIRYSTLVKSN